MMRSSRHTGLEHGGEVRLQVEPATTAGLVAVAAQLMSEYAASMPFDLSFQSFAQELAGLPGEYSAPTGCLLVATLDGAPAGCVALRKWGEGACEMKRLYVRPSSRGHGVGRALALAVVAVAKAGGYREMLLDTTPTMTEAQALYRSLGFDEIEAYRHNPVPGTRYMRLELAQREATHK